MEGNVGQIMAEVAVSYWGEPQSKRGSEWRWGTHGSRTIDLKRGCFFDFEAQEGGGIVDLIRREEGADAQVGAILEQRFNVEDGQADRVKPNEWLTSAYDYIDEHGEVRYQVLRYEPKTFRQRSRGSDGQWRNSMEGIEALPYHLPDILSRPMDNLYIVEGEKACDTLRKEGLLVTTSHGGAGNWKPELDRWFSGRKIVILPDNDDAGRAHALKIARRIHKGNWIKIVELPGLAPKGDIVDWLEAGNTVQELKALVKATNLYDPDEDDEPEIEIVEEEQESTFELFTAEDAMTMPPISFLIDGYLPKKSFSMLYGPPGSGKSFLALEMALSIAHGRQWRSRDVVKSAVIYLASEGFAGMGQRLKGWYAHNQVSDHCDLRFIRVPVDFLQTEEVEKLIRTINLANLNVSLIVVDTVARSFSGDENSAQEMGAFIKACSALSAATDAAVMGVHHSSKDRSRGLRGSSALLGAVDTVIGVDKDDAGIIDVKIEKQKDAVEAEPIKLALQQVSINGGSSAVLIDVDSEAEADRRPNLSTRESIALDALTNLLNDLKVQEVSVAQWHDAHKDKAPDTTRPNRSKARDALQVKGYIAIDGGKVWLRR
jgi:hypothetical protein